jgi:hypothetical protein
MLEPDGVFHVIEFHPLAAMLGDDGRTFQHGYFHAPEPECDVEEGSYANRLADFRHVTYEWSHDLAEVVNALIGAGLRLESLHEYPFSPYNCFPFLEEREPGRWYARTGGPVLPMVFSIRARRPAG